MGRLRNKRGQFLSLNKRDNEQRLKLYNKGYFDDKISKLLGVSTNTIHKWRNKRHLPSNRDYIKVVSLRPTKEWGYFCGVVLGDGHVDNYIKSYRTMVGSTKPDIVDIFIESANRLNLKPIKYITKPHYIKAPNGLSKWGRYYWGIIYSKNLYNALKPYKQKDYHWEIPKFLTTEESQLGFIGGLFDAEGCVGERTLNISSKHKENLEPVKNLLLKFGFKFGKISLTKDKNYYKLNISGLNIKLFYDLIELRLKKEKLKCFLQKANWIMWKYSKEDYEKVMKLREKTGWGRIKISKATGLSPSTVGRWINCGMKPLRVYYD